MPFRSGLKYLKTTQPTLPAAFRCVSLRHHLLPLQGIEILFPREGAAIPNARLTMDRGAAEAVTHTQGPTWKGICSSIMRWRLMPFWAMVDTAMDTASSGKGLR